ncbi:hypothetical protein CDD83_6029 [Cordyceps sp. RAO-2017]|nr:hypothetical protein CDD83_6029 [Cordyceps sp. RAO-2017]
MTANYDSENYKEDPALEDEEVPVELASGGKGGARSAAAPQQQQQQLEEEDELDEDELGEEVATPINLHIVVEKPGQAAGAMSIDAVAHDGQLNVENVWYHADAQEARSDDAPLRSKAYLGPPFGSLDEDLQVLLERFLEERGIGQAMAIFVPDYVNAKEQREYLRWLADVKTFVEA